MTDNVVPPRRKLWKADQGQWLPRLVEGEPYPGRDEEGDVCYDNTHFRTPEAAWENLEANVEAGVKHAGQAVVAARERLREAEARAADAAADFHRFTENRRKMAPTKGAIGDV